MQTLEEMDAMRRELEELAEREAERQASRQRSLVLRAGAMAMFSMGGTLAPVGRYARRFSQRAIHPRWEAFRVGAWGGDGVAVNFPAGGGVSRQFARLVERRRAKAA